MKARKKSSSSSSASSSSSSSSSRRGSKRGRPEKEKDVPASAQQHDLPMAFSLPASGLSSSTELVRNPLTPVPGPGEWQIQLGMVVNDRYCPCVYVSPAAVHAHHLPALPGWYLEVPDEEVNFELLVGVHKSVSQRFSIWIEVDGQIADRLALGKRGNFCEVQGFCVGRKHFGAAYVQPFKLSKAPISHNAYCSRDDDAKENVDKSIPSRRKIGTIRIMVFGVKKVAQKHQKQGQRRRYKFERQELLLEEKSSFGVERSVDAGPVVRETSFLSNYRSDGRLIAELTVFYRTARFMETLACRIHPLTQSDQKKRIKVEPINTDKVLRDDKASIEAFLSFFAQKEEMELDEIEPIGKELRKRHCTTVGELRQLREEQWKQIMRIGRLPASAARSAMKLLALPPADVIIIN